MNLIATLEAEQIEKLGKTIPEFQPGDTLIVNVKVKEGERTRVQAYEGVCIARKGGGLNESFTVRKISYGEGVERVFPDLFADDQLDQGFAARQGPARQALLSARSPRQVGTYRRAHGSSRRQGCESRQGARKGLTGGHRRLRSMALQQRRRNAAPI